MEKKTPDTDNNIIELNEKNEEEKNQVKQTHN